MVAGKRSQQPNPRRAQDRSEELRLKLQNELLSGLDSGPEDSGNEESGSPAPGVVGRGGGTLGPVGVAALSENEILLSTGDDRLEDVTQLILRDKQLSNLCVSPAVDFGSLVSLEVLSLSNNNIVDIGPLASLEALVELNINFNRISDFSPLHECELLEKLFAAHNECQTIAGLDAGCPRLRELSLYANRLAGMAEVMETLQSFANLCTLDLGENACLAGPASRYGLIRTLPRLDTLDGKRLTLVDRQLADDFFEAAATGGGANNGLESEAGVLACTRPSPSRPRTAPAAAFPRPPPLPPAAGERSPALPLGSLPGQRLRSSRANLIDDVLTSDSHTADGNKSCTRRRLPSLDVKQLDLRNPQRTLHTLSIHAEALRRHLEVLQMERDNLRFEVRLLQRDAKDAAPVGLAEQLERLQEENRAWPAVEGEHTHLKALIAQAEGELSRLNTMPTSKAADLGGAQVATANSLDDDGLLGELRWENKLLRKRLQGLSRHATELQEHDLRARLQSSRSTMVPGEMAKLALENEAKLRRLQDEVRDTATAVARRNQQASGDAEASASEDPLSAARVDVLRLGEGTAAQAEEWHGMNVQW